MTGPEGLSRARTVILWALAIVWFAEMTLWGVRPLSDMWTRFWEVASPGDAQLATGIYLAHAVEAAAKGALGVLAVYALRSGAPFVRSALFIPMALVPPLNVAFPFRAQGFPVRPTLIGVSLSVILWNSFFLFKDRAEPSAGVGDVIPRASLSWREWLQYAWFAVNAILLTLAAVLFLSAPDVGLRLAFPCASGLLDTARMVPSSLTIIALTVGAHLTAVATATWIGTFYPRSSGTVRRAVATANTIHAGLICALPLSQLALDEVSCATSSALMYAIPLFAGWLLYAALTRRASVTVRMPRAHPAAR